MSSAFPLAFPLSRSELSDEIPSALFDPPSRSDDHKSPHPAGGIFPPKFDVVWTWVNGSDPLHQKTIMESEKKMVAIRK